MEHFSLDELDRLLARPAAPAISIYQPTHRSAAESAEDRIRFKNLVREAEDRLTARGMRAADARQLLAPVLDLIDQSLFWRSTAPGLAVFAAPGFLRTYRLPEPVEELVAVGERFHLTPLLPLLTGDGRFHVLALSRNAVRCLRCSRYSVAPVQLPGALAGLEESQRFDVFEKQLKFHTRPPVAAGSRPAMVQHGVGIDDDKAKLLVYLREVETALSAALRGENSPLVLAAVEYLHPLFHQVNRYPHLLEEGIRRNPEPLTGEELRHEAWLLVEPRFKEAVRKEAERYRELGTRGRATSDLSLVLRRAREKRVEALFVTPQFRSWGIFDGERGEVVAVHPAPEIGDEDLLNRAAIEVLSGGGTVVGVAPEEMPDAAPVAAILRY
jgi:hypothetical protein